MTGRFEMVRITRAAVIGSLLVSLALAVWAQTERPVQTGPQGAERPAGVFHTDVPAHPLDVILGRPTRDAVTVSVLSYSDAEGYVEWGATPGEYPMRLPACDFRQGEARELVLGGLAPDTAYHYRLVTRSAPGAAFSAALGGGFRTQRSPGSGFTFTLTADSHLDENTAPALYAQTLANALADAPDFHIDLGDTFMTDKRADFRSAGPQYLAQRHYLGLVGRSAPVFLVLGNHDGEEGRWLGRTEDNTAVWANRTRRSLFPNPAPDGFYTGNAEPLQDYYAWEWGDALFIVLDPYWYTPRQRGSDDNWVRTLGRVQYDWLRATLEHSRAPLRFVFIHQLVGGRGRDGRGGAEAAGLYEWGGHSEDGTDVFATKRPGWPMPIHRLLAAHGVDVVFHGHDHLYAKQDLDGIVYQEVPQPGFPGRANPAFASEWGYESGVLLPSSGHMRVKVSPEGATVEYVRAQTLSGGAPGPQNGAVAHSYTIGLTG